MVITTIVENSKISKEYESKHGLCIHIKTEKSNILFDLGPDDTFIKNAEKLNIDLKEVDIVIISHGHKDHGGGLEAFLKCNNKAKIYISKYAFEDYYASVLKYLKVYIGLNKDLKNNERIILTDKIYSIDKDAILVGDIKGNILRPEGNNNLLIKKTKEYILDDFKHEQHLILKSKTKNILISGCSHGGILNILEDIKNREGLDIDVVIGGLHLYNPINKKSEKDELIDELGRELIKKNIKIYTCHCTGEKGYNLLKNKLKEDINTIKTGQILEVE